jgi:hypothetical protein
MKVSGQDGHFYQLQNYLEGDGQNMGLQDIQFMKKENGVLVEEGTTNEEVIKMMIERMNYLQTKFPCRENSIVITKLEECLMWLNYRTSKRVAQGVEGKDIAHK